MGTAVNSFKSVEIDEQIDGKIDTEKVMNIYEFSMRTYSQIWILSEEGVREKNVFFGKGECA